MKKIVTIVLIAILFFGCIDLGGGKKNDTQIAQQNNTTTLVNSTNTTTIIITGQQNQTVKNNRTIIIQNTTPQPKKTEYTYEPNVDIVTYFIDLGSTDEHGNAVLIKKGDFDVLVDAGSKNNAGKVIDTLRSKGVDDIDLLVSTNPDPRNYGGIEQVASSYKIENFWYGEEQKDANYSAMVANLIQTSKFSRKITRGYKEQFNGIDFLVLNPKEDKFENLNNDAAVLRIKDRAYTMLLTSGIYAGAQGELINQESENIKVKVMQAPYYGSGSGTSNIGVWLINAKPEKMIITGSGDESAPNGGSRDPFRRLLGQYKIPYYETYKNGTIKITSDGADYAIQTQR